MLTTSRLAMLVTAGSAERTGFTVRRADVLRRVSMP
jgi:hypothetical protein